ncbi:MAG: hypothetical protein IKW18_04125, partial [Clostridia bacterium]|nr:hypothetical protein [Clostridia bacterium]
LNNEVWIALRKEEETYGILMPAVAHRPKACTEGENDGDTFVILGINLPKSYILNAEKKLEEEIIKYMRENNEEKFKFSISFSRIFFEESEENKRILESINENARLVIRYNGKPYNDGGVTGSAAYLEGYREGYYFGYSDGEYDSYWR